MVYPGHEYTLENIRFAKLAEPHNADLLERETRDRETRNHGRPTLPAPLSLEKRTNPFLRCREAALIEAAGATPHAVVIALDRQEMATENGQDVPYSAVQYVRERLGLQVAAIAKLADLLQYLQQHSSAGLAADHQRVLAYRQRYGVNEG